MGNLGEIMMFIDLEMMGKGITELLNIGILLLGKFQVFGVFKPVVMMRRGPCLRPPPKRTRGWSTTS